MKFLYLKTVVTWLIENDYSFSYHAGLNAFQENYIQLENVRIYTLGHTYLCEWDNQDTQDFSYEELKFMIKECYQDVYEKQGGNDYV